MAPSRSTLGRHRVDGRLPARARHQGDRRGRTRGRRRARASRGRWRSAGRGPVGYYKDPEKTAATFRVIDGERWTDPGRLRHGRRRRHGPPARPRLGVHQHRRREGLPRGGRGGPQAASRRSPTPWWSGCPTSASGDRRRRASSRARGGRGPTSRPDRTGCESAWPAYKAPAGVLPSRPSAGRPTARSTTPPEGYAVSTSAGDHSESDTAR